MRQAELCKSGRPIPVRYRQLRGRRQRDDHRDARTPTRRYLQPNLGVLAVAAAGVLCAFCCVVDALSEQCLRRRPSTNPLVAAVFRTRRLLRERCSATCPRRRRPGQVRHTQGGLQITADLCPSRFTLGTRPGRTDGSLCLAAVTSAWLRRRAFNRSAVAIAAGGSSSSWMLSVDRCWKWSRL
jgi:hypothetical protein